MATFRALDKRLYRDVGLLHDFLWQEWKGDPGKLRRDLLAEAREFDAFLGAGGKIRRHAEALERGIDKDKEGHGAALYELLSDTYNLTAATEHVRKKDYKGAAEHAAWAVESMSIGVCSAAGRFDIVEKWEHGGGGFEPFTGALADMLERKGVARAGEYKRLLLAVRNFGREWDASASPEQQALAARAAVASAAWCAVTTGLVRESIGAPRKFSEKDYAAVVSRIVARL